MLARTRRNTRWPRRRSSFDTAWGAPDDIAGFRAGSGLSCAIGFAPLVELAAGAWVLVGIGVGAEAAFGAGTLKDSSFKARHPRNRSQWFVIPRPHPIRQCAAYLSRLRGHRPNGGS